MNATQAQQDRIENGGFGTSGGYNLPPQAQHEPSSKCCGTPYIKMGVDDFRCLGCNLRYPGLYLRAIGIRTILIG